VVLGDELYQRRHSRAVVLEPRHLLSKIVAVGADLVAKVMRGEAQPVVEAPLVQKERARLHELLDIGAKLDPRAAHADATSGGSALRVDTMTALNCQE
jgi:hypothetical protein